MWGDSGYPSLGCEPRGLNGGRLTRLGVEVGCRSFEPGVTSFPEHCAGWGGSPPMWQLPARVRVPCLPAGDGAAPDHQVAFAFKPASIKYRAGKHIISPLKSRYMLRGRRWCWHPESYHAAPAYPKDAPRWLRTPCRVAVYPVSGYDCLSSLRCHCIRCQRMQCKPGRLRRRDSLHY